MCARGYGCIALWSLFLLSKGPLHEYRYLLPPHLQEQEIIVAWRAPEKLGGMLIPFRSDTSRIDDGTGHKAATRDCRGDSVYDQMPVYRDRLRFAIYGQRLHAM